MKKIMFNDRYGLTEAVLNGRKTMTRRILKGDYETIKAYHANGGWFFIADTGEGDSVGFRVGEVVAIAQSYKSAGYEPGRNIPVKEHGGLQVRADSLKGWRNKMFVKADLMPHLIRITNIKVERLQDISDEDCRKEGIMEGEFTNTWDTFYYDHWGDVPNHITFRTPRQAFASLIDKISGKGTWQKNPWVFAYEFELVQ